MDCAAYKVHLYKKRPDRQNARRTLFISTIMFSPHALRAYSSTRAAHTRLTYFRRSVLPSRCPGRQSRLQASAGLSVTMYRGTDYNNPCYCGSLSSDIQTSQRIEYPQLLNFLRNSFIRIRFFIMPSPSRTCTLSTNP